MELKDRYGEPMPLPNRQCYRCGYIHKEVKEYALRNKLLHKSFRTNLCELCIAEFKKRDTWKILGVKE